MQKNVRETSIEAYNKIKDNGLLSKRRFQVYDILFEFGPMTANECFLKMKEYYAVMGVITNSNTTTRLGELRDLGVARELGKRICSVSGNKVILWDVTDGLPVKFEKATKVLCSACKGKGFFESQQSKLF